MADVELSAALNSGLITNIYLDGTTVDEKVLKSSEVDTKITAITDPLDVRVTHLEDSHSLLINASSTAATQQPTVVDTALQIEFGIAQVTTDIDLSVAGALTFKTAGKYIISPFFQYGRVGASGTSTLFNRILVNGVQLGSSLGANIDNANTLVPWSSSIQFTANTNDVVTIEIIRDSTGNNSGGLFSSTPTAVGWSLAPCAAIQIYKAI